jgi:hypothetical protein
MRENHWKMEEALTYVKEKRGIVEPNLGFKKQLKQFEFELGLIDEEQLKKEMDILIPPWERINNSNYLKTLEKKDI